MMVLWRALIRTNPVAILTWPFEEDWYSGIQGSLRLVTVKAAGPMTIIPANSNWLLSQLYSYCDPADESYYDNGVKPERTTIIPYCESVTR